MSIFKLKSDTRLFQRLQSDFLVIKIESIYSSLVVVVVLDGDDDVVVMSMYV